MTTTTPGTWLTPERDALAVDRILDAAGELFAERGVATVGMAEIAAAAGCSRATLYRYFPNRLELRAAFVHRAARRLGAEVAAKVDGVPDPERRLEKAVLAAVAGVRSDPTMAAWFVEDSAGIASGMAQASEVIGALAASFLGDAADRRTRDAAAWVVRVVVSLLVMPAADAAEERRLVRRYLVPAVVS
jgi:AcrR family transcriptional regulator